jgi:penicillin-binding protein 2
MKKSNIFKNIVYLEGGNKKWKVATQKSADSERWLSNLLPAESNLTDVDSGKKHGSFLAILGITSLALIILVGRLYNMQILKGNDSLVIAEGNRVHEVVTRAPRGIVYDKNNIPLVKNVPNYDLNIIPNELPKTESDRQNVIRELAKIVSINEEEIRKKLTKEVLFTAQPILVTKDLSKDQSILIETKIKDLPGIRVDVNPVREYLDGGLLAHALGYVGRISEEELENNNNYILTDYIGKSGLEKSYESTLRGVMGRDRYEVDSTGKSEKHLGLIEAVPGDNVKLSIDFELQKKLVEALKKQMDGAKVERASAVAINPQNGQILALASLPTYDNNLFAKGISDTDYKKLLDDPNSPLLFRAIAGEYPSGSTIKPFIAAGALEEGVINESTTVNSTGGIKIGEFSFPDWKSGGHGTTNVLKAIAESVNTFFYAIGGGYEGITGIGAEKMKLYLEKFGFGNYCGLDIMGESKGSIPDSEWKQRVKNEPWYLGDSYHMAIGQGDILVTPLQLANATAAIANGGKLYEPTLVQSVIDGAGQTKSETTPKLLSENFISLKTIDIIRRGMRMTVTDGSARMMKDIPVEIAGKTGTAQYGPNNSKSHAWFITFAPFNNPNIAMVVLIEGAGGGDKYAVPVANDVYRWYFSR